MADANVSRLGQVQGAGDDKALFMKQYAGEVLTSFGEEYKLAGRIVERNIQHGKSASFPNLGTIGSGYHTPGTDIKGRVVQANETVITLDPMLISDAFIANIDEAMNHYDVRSEYSRQQGLELAKQRQLNELRCVIQAARAVAGPVPGQPGGTKVVAATAGTDAAVLADSIKSVRQAFDEKLTPVQDNTLVLAPAQYYLLTENKDLVNRDYNPNTHGDHNDAVLYSVARFPIVMSTHIPQSDDSANAAIQTKYQGDYSTVVAVLFNKYAAGTLKLLDLSMEAEYTAVRQGTLMLAKFALGHGPLRPGCAAVIQSA